MVVLAVGLASGVHAADRSTTGQAAQYPADNSGLLVLRAATDRPGAELEIDVDDLSGSNNTSIDLPQPAGGWKTSITEAEYLCFYDATSWPLSHRQPGKTVTLPAGCGA